MTTKLTTCLQSSRRAGLTLIEVVAAIAILGTMLVGVVLANARHTRQIAVAQRTRAAVRAADELIAQWWASEEGVPIEQRGELGPDHRLSWESRIAENEVIGRLGARVVRVEFRDSGSDGPVKAKGEPLFIVDLVLPDAPAGKDKAVTHD